MIPCHAERTIVPLATLNAEADVHGSLEKGRAIVETAEPTFFGIISHGRCIRSPIIRQETARFRSRRRVEANPVPTAEKAVDACFLRATLGFCRAL
jgi:hypothetical protein